MTAHELNEQLIQHNWTGDLSETKGKYVIPSKMRYALVLSLNDPSLAEQTSCIPYWMHYETQNMLKANERFAHQYDPVPRNKTIAELMQEYGTKGTKIPARVELKKRVEHIPFDEQKQVLCAFLSNNAVDRKFALKYLDEHWDEFYMPDVEKVWLQYRHKEAAVLIVHHFPQEFILAHQSELADAYNYLQVRLRLPATFIIDKERLSDSAYLYLCARQSIEIDDQTAESLLYRNLLKAISWFYIKAPWHVNPKWTAEDYFNNGKSLCDISVISSMIWSLGKLEKSDILVRFIEFHEKVYPLIMQAKWDELRSEFSKLGFDFDYTPYDEAVIGYEQRVIEMNRTAEEMELKALPDDLDLSNFTLSNDPNSPF